MFVTCSIKGITPLFQQIILQIRKREGERENKVKEGEKKERVRSRENRELEWVEKREKDERREREGEWRREREWCGSSFVWQNFCKVKDLLKCSLYAHTHSMANNSSQVTIMNFFYYIIHIVKDLMKCVFKRETLPWTFSTITRGIFTY